MTDKEKIININNDNKEEFLNLTKNKIPSIDE